MGMDIVQILGYGLTGLGFLLMFLAYRLVDKVISTRSAQPLVISTINRFMFVCLIMSVLVGVFTFVNARYKQDELEAKTEVIRNKELALNILGTAQQNDLLSDRILAKTDSLGIVSDPGKREALKQEI